MNLQPEIIVPLRHLTSTLEVLGHILLMRNDMHESMRCLERACPLMELLPASGHEDHRFAVGCFALLREVYGKLYSIDDNDENDRNINGNDDSLGGGGTDDEIGSNDDFEGSEDQDEIVRKKNRRRRKRRKQSSIFYSDDSDSKNSDSAYIDGHKLALHTPLDIDKRFEDLRSPFNHLRAELHQQNMKNQPPPLQISYKQGTGLATATADLDALVQRFVFEDSDGRFKLFHMAKDYYDAMTDHMESNPQLIAGLGGDLDIVYAYIEVLKKVNVEEGFDFISIELDNFNLITSDGDYDIQSSDDRLERTDEYQDNDEFYEDYDDNLDFHKDIDVDRNLIEKGNDEGDTEEFDDFHMNNEYMPEGYIEEKSDDNEEEDRYNSDQSYENENKSGSSSPEILNNSKQKNQGGGGEVNEMGVRRDLSSKEKNRLMVLNAFERALSDTGRTSFPLDNVDFSSYIRRAENTDISQGYIGIYVYEYV